MAKSVAKVPFKRIRERAAKRKGGEKVLASLMPKKPNNKALAKLPDDREMSEMAAVRFGQYAQSKQAHSPAAIAFCEMKTPSFLGGETSDITTLLESASLECQSRRDPGHMKLPGARSPCEREARQERYVPRLPAEL